MAREAYNTKQKKLIYNLISDNKHMQLSCDCIVDILKKNGTPVGKATVYRFLENLAEKGEVRKFIDPESKIASFQYIDKELNCQGHMHLKCINCGKLFHLSCEYMSDVSEHIMKHHSFKIDNSKTVILGCCEKCTE